MNTNTETIDTASGDILSPEYKRGKIIQAIAECDRFIAKEQPRREDLRPQEMKDLLAFYISHRAKLQTMLEQ